MGVLPALVVLLLVTLAPTQELTVGQVIAAHRAGTPEQGILRLIREAHAVASLRAVWLASRAHGTSGTVSELRIRTTAGGDLTFRDADWANGGTDPVAALYRMLETRFPQAILREKSAR